MAVTILSSRHFLFMMLPICFFLLLSIHVPLAISLNFSVNFSDSGSYCAPGAMIFCSGDASFHAPAMELTKNDIHSSSWNIGRVWYAQQVQLWKRATGEVSSFTTSFSFRIEPISVNFTGDGMAFFLGSYPPVIPPGSYGEYLGLVNSSSNLDAMGSDRIVAVEFDTFMNYVEKDGNHIGIDVNSIASVNSISLDKNLTSGTTMTAVIEYKNTTKNLSVILWINETSYQVSTTVDMRKSLPEQVAIGFSAATGRYSEVHQVLSWSFSSTLAEDDFSVTPPQGPAASPAVTSKPQAKLSNVLAAIASSVAISFLVLCAFMGFLLRRRLPWKKKELIGAGPRRYRYSELAAATGNFTEEKKLGRGGFGHVYRGCLRVDDQDRHVAIKKLSPESSAQGRKEFEAEVKIISQLRHRNLVELIGWCDSSKGLLIVYELVPEGSLDKHLYNKARLLTWSERYNIIIGLGSALGYLHAEWGQQILHGDIKPSNIMLDSSYNTKLGDFGLARLADHGAELQTTKVVMGTAGYIDPELVNTSRPSTESDVYSFGVVLLEIVSGRRPVMENDVDEVFVLLRWVWDLQRKNAAVEAVDERLRACNKVEDEWQMARVVVVGLWCVHPDRSERPSMAQAMHVLQSKDAKLPSLSPQTYKPDLATGEDGYSSLFTGTSSSLFTGTSSSDDFN